MGKGGSKIVHTITHPEEIVSGVISHTNDLTTTIKTVTDAAIHHQQVQHVPVHHANTNLLSAISRPKLAAHTAHIDSITISKIPTITGQPGAIVSRQTFPPTHINSNTATADTFMTKIETSLQNQTVVISAVSGAAVGLALGGDNRALAMIVGGVCPVLAHAALSDPALVKTA